MITITITKTTETTEHWPDPTWLRSAYSSTPCAFIRHADPSMTTGFRGTWPAPCLDPADRAYIPEPVRVAAERVWEDNRPLELNEIRGASGSVGTLSAPTFDGCSVQYPGDRGPRRASIDMFFGGGRPERVRAWHRVEYMKIIADDECCPPGEVPRRMTENEVRLRDGSAAVVQKGGRGGARVCGIMDARQHARFERIADRFEAEYLAAQPAPLAPNEFRQPAHAPPIKMRVRDGVLEMAFSFDNYSRWATLGSASAVAGLERTVAEGDSNGRPWADESWPRALAFYKAELAHIEAERLAAGTTIDGRRVEFRALACVDDSYLTVSTPRGDAYIHPQWTRYNQSGLDSPGSLDVPRDLYRKARAWAGWENEPEQSDRVTVSREELERLHAVRREKAPFVLAVERAIDAVLDSAGDA